MLQEGVDKKKAKAETAWPRWHEHHEQSQQRQQPPSRLRAEYATAGAAAPKLEELTTAELQKFIQEVRHCELSAVLQCGTQPLDVQGRVLQGGIQCHRVTCRLRAGRWVLSSAASCSFAGYT